MNAYDEDKVKEYQASHEYLEALAEARQEIIDEYLDTDEFKDELKAAEDEIIGEWLAEGL